MYQNYLNQYPSYPPMYSNNNTLNGMYVESRAVVDSTQSDLNGKPTFLPTTDGSAIYVKQLDNFGKSHVTTYLRQVEEYPKPHTDDIIERLNVLEQKIDRLSEVAYEPANASTNDTKQKPNTKE